MFVKKALTNSNACSSMYLLGDKFSALYFVLFQTEQGQGGPRVDHGCDVPCDVPQGVGVQPPLRRQGLPGVAGERGGAQQGMRSH